MKNIWMLLHDQQAHMTEKSDRRCGFNFFIHRQKGETNSQWATRTQSVADNLKTAAGSKEGQINIGTGRITLNTHKDSTFNHIFYNQSSQYINRQP